MFPRPRSQYNTAVDYERSVKLESIKPRLNSNVDKKNQSLFGDPLLGRVGCILRRRHLLWILLLICFITFLAFRLPDHVYEERHGNGVEDKSENLLSHHDIVPQQFFYSKNAKLKTATDHLRARDAKHQPFRKQLSYRIDDLYPEKPESRMKYETRGIRGVRRNHDITMKHIERKIGIVNENEGMNQIMDDTRKKKEKHDRFDRPSIFIERPFLAAIYRPLPWLPFHTTTMTNEHLRRYDHWTNCMESNTSNSKRCFAEVEQESGDYDQQNKFDVKMRRKMEEEHIDQFPARWLLNFNDLELMESKLLGDYYAKRIINGTMHGYNAYKQYGWGFDEIHPLTLKSSNWVNLAVTMIDSLGTLWLIGAFDEFYEATDWISKVLAKFDSCFDNAMFFEVTIRVLGGLISAASLSGHSGLIKTSELMGRRYLAAFFPHLTVNCPWNPEIPAFTKVPDFNQKCYSSSDLPLHFDSAVYENFQFPPRNINLCNLSTQLHHTRPNTHLALSGTFQMEFRALSMLTGDYRYQQIADHVTYVIQKASNISGGYRYLPRYQISTTVKPKGDFRIGAETDSYVEMLIKQWIQTGKAESSFLALWNGAIDDIISTLLIPSPSFTGLTQADEIPVTELDITKWESIALQLIPSNGTLHYNQRLPNLPITEPLLHFRNQSNGIFDIIERLKISNGKISVSEILQIAYKTKSLFMNEDPPNLKIPLATNRYMQQRLIDRLSDTMELLESWNDGFWDSYRSKPDAYEPKGHNLRHEDDELSQLLLGLRNHRKQETVGKMDPNQRTANEPKRRLLNEYLNRHLKDHGLNNKPSFDILDSDSISLSPILYALYLAGLQVGTPLYEALLVASNGSQLIPNVTNSDVVHDNILEHLACFLPGTLFLSVMSQWESLPTDTQGDYPNPFDVNLSHHLVRLIEQIKSNPKLIEDSEWMRRFRLLSQTELGKSILDGCLLSYLKSPKLLGFDSVHLIKDTSGRLSSSKIRSPLTSAFSSFPQLFPNQTDDHRRSSFIESSETDPFTELIQSTPLLDIRRTPLGGQWLKRPEIIESLYYLHYYTGNPRYRRIAAHLFDAIDEHLRVDPGGYASADEYGRKADGSESFFISETLKYLYLIFAPPETLDLNKWVFTTEAHPLPVVKNAFGTSSRISPQEFLRPYMER